MDTAYTPVPYACKEMIDEAIQQQTKGKVFYFDAANALEVAEGTVVNMEEGSEGVFITLKPEAKIRIDRIITLFGKPAAAFDEYDAYANACMNCTGGDDV